MYLNPLVYIRSLWTHCVHRSHAHVHIDGSSVLPWTFLLYFALEFPNFVGMIGPGR
jgi:hypothetical protein